MKKENGVKNMGEKRELKKTKGKKKIDIYKWGGILLLLVGICLVAYQPVVNYLIKPQQLSTEYTKVFDADKDLIKENGKKKENQKDSDFSKVTMLTGDLKLNYRIDKNALAGEILVPSVDLHLPILYGTTNAHLNVAGTTMKANQKMGEGNYALAGHNAKNPKILFAPLHRVKKGDYIYITDKTNIYKYAVTTYKEIQPTETKVIKDVEGEQLITLITCYDDTGKTRLLVQGRLVDSEKYRNNMKLEKR